MARTGNKLVKCGICGTRRRYPGTNIQLLHEDTKYRVWESRNPPGTKGGYVTKWLKAGDYVCPHHEPEESQVL